MSREKTPKIKLPKPGSPEHLEMLDKLAAELVKRIRKQDESPAKNPA